MGNLFFLSFESLGKKIFFSEKVKNFSNLVGSQPKRPTEMEKKNFKMRCSLLVLEVALDA